MQRIQLTHDMLVFKEVVDEAQILHGRQYLTQVSLVVLHFSMRLVLFLQHLVAHSVERFVEDLEVVLDRVLMRNDLVHDQLSFHHVIVLQLCQLVLHLELQLHEWHVVCVVHVTVICAQLAVELSRDLAKEFTLSAPMPVAEDGWLVCGAQAEVTLQVLAITLPLLIKNLRRWLKFVELMTMLEQLAYLVVTRLQIYACDLAAWLVEFLAQMPDDIVFFIEVQMLLFFQRLKVVLVVDYAQVKLLLFVEHALLFSQDRYGTLVGYAILCICEHHFTGLVYDDAALVRGRLQDGLVCEHLLGSFASLLHECLCTVVLRR